MTLKALRDLIAQGGYQPGDRFLSAREVAQRFGLSFQTAHRLLNSLCEQGLLEARPRSGIYLPGGSPRYRGVDLFFNRRARRLGSFGQLLLSMLRPAYVNAGFDCRAFWSTRRAARPGRLPVIWESPDLLAVCIERRLPAILINRRAPFGINALNIDSVSLDDFAGGVCAAELVRDRMPNARRPRNTVLAGPRGDSRSLQRIDGFRSVAKAEVVHAEGWYFEHGRAAGPQVLSTTPESVFCCNDRLAEGFLRYCSERGHTPPALVGFDNAPVAKRLNLTTIAIPWDEMVERVVTQTTRRISGRAKSSTQHIVAPRPLVRGSLPSAPT